MREIVVFSGSAHRSLAQAICAELGVELSLGRDDPLQQRLPPGPAPGQLPPARRLHRPAAGAADPGAPDGAAADDRRRAGRQRRPDHRGDPALRLRPVGQEGRLADLARRPPGRRHAHHRRRRPGADDDAARPAGARVLLGARRPPHRARRARRPLLGGRPLRRRGRLPRPRQRQDGHPVLPAARAAGRGGQQAPAGRRRGGHRRHRGRRGRQAGDRARRRDRHRRLHRRAARPPRRRGLHQRRRRLHARALRRQGRRPAPAAPDDLRGGHHRHRPGAAGLARAPGAPGGRPVRRGDRPRPRRRVGQQPLRRGRPRARPARSPGCSTSAPAPGRGAPPGDPGRARR